MTHTNRCVFVAQQLAQKRMENARVERVVKVSIGSGSLGEIQGIPHGVVAVPAASFLGGGCSRW